MYIRAERQATAATQTVVIGSVRRPCARRTFGGFNAVGNGRMTDHKPHLHASDPLGSGGPLAYFTFPNVLAGLRNTMPLGGVVVVVVFGKLSRSIAFKFSRLASVFFPMVWLLSSFVCQLLISAPVCRELIAAGSACSVYNMPEQAIVDTAGNKGYIIGFVSCRIHDGWTVVGSGGMEEGGRGGEGGGGGAKRRGEGGGGGGSKAIRRS